MKGKRLNTRSLLLTCWCLLLSTIIVSETLALVKVSSLSTSSTTLSTAQLLLADEFRAGAFGSHDAADNDEDRDESESKPKGKQNNNNDNNATVEEYVAAMRERDAGKDSTAVMDDSKDNNSDTSSSSSPSAESSDSAAVSATTTTLEAQDNDKSMGDQESGSEESSVVGVKSHKKSNAVGDPDDDDDDDDGDISDDDEDDDDDNVDDIDDDDIDDENDSQSEYSEEWEEIEETFDQYTDNNMFEPQVEVGVEMVEEEGIVDHRHMKAKTKGGGGVGVGVRLGRIANRRKNNRRKTEKTETLKPPSYDQARLLRAWNPFVYLPPTPSALSFLSDNARLLDSSSKNRLDRRTLYAGLLLEWGATDSKLSSSTRKFLPAESSQALQAALSLATQPQWRKSTPRTSGIRLYSDDENAKGSTLGMQETIAMSLVSRSWKLW
jgi:hypothetical protein